MQAKVVHYLTIAAAVVAGVALAIKGAVGNLPEKWQPAVLMVAGVAVVLAAALTAARVALAADQLTHDSKVAGIHMGLTPQEAVNFAHNDTPQTNDFVAPEVPVTDADVAAELGA